MNLTSTKTPIRTGLASIAFVLALTACGGNETPEALPQVDEPATSSEVEAELVVAPAQTPSTTVAVAPTTTTEPPSAIAIPPTPTTSVVPVEAPMAPTLVVECATNPPQLTVTFAEDAGTPLDWTVVAHVHPGGTGLPAQVVELATGTDVPTGPQVYDIEPNNLQFDVTVENELGDEFTAVGVDRYSGCPLARSFSARLVDPIDCVTGSFTFLPADGSGITVDSISVDRISGDDTAFAPSPFGIYYVPNWSGPEEVKAVVTFSDDEGTYEEHINHNCFGDQFGFGDYEVCHDEALSIAHPAEWDTKIDLYGAEGQSCGFFRTGVEDGESHHHVTIRPLDMTLAEAADTVLPPGPWTVVNTDTVPAGTFVEPAGPSTKNFTRVSYELAWTDSPDFIRRKVWLFEVGDNKVFRMEANLEGLDEIDAMANSIQFFMQ